MYPEFRDKIKDKFVFRPSASCNCGAGAAVAIDGQQK